MYSHLTPGVTSNLSVSLQTCSANNDIFLFGERHVNNIINTYDSQDPLSNKGKVLNYLIQKRCKLLIESVGEFIL